MNRENLAKLAETLEAEARGLSPIPGLGFNMLSWVCRVDEEAVDRSGRGCGTVACIGGTALALREQVKDAEEAFGLVYTFEGVLSAAADWLGLDDQQAYDLFVPNEEELDWSRIGPGEAARAVRKLAETGTVDWSECEWEDG